MKIKNILFITIILISSLALGGCFHNQQQQLTPDKSTQTTQSGKSGGSQNETVQPAVNTLQNYVEYTPTIVVESAGQGKKVVLFFHAPWCPYCKAAEADILNRIDEIPENIIIVKTDYDTYSDLKKKYGITYQHTFVQVDAQGNQITIWNGGDLDEIIKNVQ